jgi:delta-aminolevulinic acid dehydratase/porphobilinogen synthase
MSYFLPEKEEGEKEEKIKTHKIIFGYFSSYSRKQEIDIFSLGEQTRYSTVQLQKKIKEMVPKQGKNIFEKYSL